jgi:hypothetical protein
MSFRKGSVLGPLKAPGKIGDIIRLWQNTRKWNGGKRWIVGEDEERKG